MGRTRNKSKPNGNNGQAKKTSSTSKQKVGKHKKKRPKYKKFWIEDCIETRIPKIFTDSSVNASADAPPPILTVLISRADLLDDFTSSASCVHHPKKEDQIAIDNNENNVSTKSSATMTLADDGIEKNENGGLDAKKVKIDDSTLLREETLNEASTKCLTENQKRNIHSHSKKNLKISVGAFKDVFIRVKRDSSVKNCQRFVLLCNKTLQ
mmetsp:Transcript_5279/g.7696  ORF Transcript_5279/g.7696 Transcript_5279/m.7696 type:complete len:210 (+) Transcript_5279:60-689(+)